MPDEKNGKIYGQAEQQDTQPAAPDVEQEEGQIKSLEDLVKKMPTVKGVGRTMKNGFQTVSRTARNFVGKKFLTKKPVDADLEQGQKQDVVEPAPDVVDSGVQQVAEAPVVVPQQDILPLEPERDSTDTEQEIQQVEPDVVATENQQVVEETSVEEEEQEETFEEALKRMAGAEAQPTETASEEEKQETRIVLANSNPNPSSSQQIENERLYEMLKNAYITQNVSLPKEQRLLDKVLREALQKGNPEQFISGQELEQGITSVVDTEQEIQQAEPAVVNAKGQEATEQETRIVLAEPYEYWQNQQSLQKQQNLQKQLERLTNAYLIKNAGLSKDQDPLERLLREALQKGNPEQFISGQKSTQATETASVEPRIDMAREDVLVEESSDLEMQQNAPAVVDKEQEIPLGEQVPNEDAQSLESSESELDYADDIEQQVAPVVADPELNIEGLQLARNLDSFKAIPKAEGKKPADGPVTEIIFNDTAATLNLQAEDTFAANLQGLRSVKEDTAVVELQVEAEKDSSIYEGTFGSITQEEPVDEELGQQGVEGLDLGTGTSAADLTGQYLFNTTAAPADELQAQATEIDKQEDVFELDDSDEPKSEAKELEGVQEESSKTEKLDISEYGEETDQAEEVEELEEVDELENPERPVEVEEAQNPEAQVAKNTNDSVSYTPNSYTTITRVSDGNGQPLSQEDLQPKEKNALGMVDVRVKEKAKEINKQCIDAQGNTYDLLTAIKEWKKIEEELKKYAQNVCSINQANVQTRFKFLGRPLSDYEVSEDGNSLKIDGNDVSSKIGLQDFYGGKIQTVEDIKQKAKKASVDVADAMRAVVDKKIFVDAAAGDSEPEIDQQEQQEVPIVGVEDQQEQTGEPIVEVENQQEQTEEPIVEVENQQEQTEEPIVEVEDQQEQTEEPIVEVEDQPETETVPVADETIIEEQTQDLQPINVEDLQPVAVKESQTMTMPTEALQLEDQELRAQIAAKDALLEALQQKLAAKDEDLAAKDTLLVALQQELAKEKEEKEQAKAREEQATESLEQAEAKIATLSQVIGKGKEMLQDYGQRADYAEKLNATKEKQIELLKKQERQLVEKLVKEREMKEQAEQAAQVREQQLAEELTKAQQAKEQAEQAAKAREQQLAEELAKAKAEKEKAEEKVKNGYRAYEALYTENQALLEENQELKTVDVSKNPAVQQMLQNQRREMSLQILQIRAEQKGLNEKNLQIMAGLDQKDPAEIADIAKMAKGILGDLQKQQPQNPSLLKKRQPMSADDLEQQKSSRSNTPVTRSQSGSQSKDDKNKGKGMGTK